MMSKFKGKKTNNAKTNAKQLLRAGVFEKIEGTRNVLDVFCGAGEMHKAIWNKADDYLGIDKVKYFDERKTICGDARKAINLVKIEDFNIFDIDAYGSPYDILEAVLPRIGAWKQLGFVLTDGSSMDLRLGRISKGLRALTGIDVHVVKRASAMHDDLVNDVIATVAQELNGTVVHKQIAKGNTGAAMIYYAFVIERF